MRAIYDFYKEKSGSWYIDLPDYSGSKADLQMVAGADKMLDIISKGKDRIAVYMSDILTVVPEHCHTLGLVNVINGGINGANYLWKKREVWLCPVTIFVFDDYPKTIYIKVV